MCRSKICSSQRDDILTQSASSHVSEGPDSKVINAQWNNYVNAEVILTQVWVASIEPFPFYLALFNSQHLPV